MPLPTLAALLLLIVACGSGSVASRAAGSALTGGGYLSAGKIAAAHEGAVLAREADDRTELGREAEEDYDEDGDIDDKRCTAQPPASCALCVHRGA